MDTTGWSLRNFSVTSLQLDPKNPRLGRRRASRTPRDIIQYLFDNDNAIDVARSIATRGYFPNEPLLAIREGGRLNVVEGNRRLAAVKALRDPSLLHGPAKGQVERLARKILDVNVIAKLPVVVAPDRRATDRQVAGRHIGTPVSPWEAQDRASFILEKLEEGYGSDDLRDQLGFNASDIQHARQTLAIADMVDALELPDEVRAKLSNPRANIFTTVRRIFDSTVGRKHLRIESDAEHGFRMKASKEDFGRALARIVTDIAAGTASSRTLNTNNDIADYFGKWEAVDLPINSSTYVLPSDIAGDPPTVEDEPPPAPKLSRKRGKQVTATVLPRDFKVKYGSDRLVDIQKELSRLKSDDYPNAGAVLLRVFLELAVLDYLDRIGELEQIVEKLGGEMNLPYGAPTMRQVAPAMIRIAKRRLSRSGAQTVEKALTYNKAAPFTVSDMHSFVHNSDEWPGSRDIRQFWARTEPLFRLMLEQEADAGSNATS